MGSEHWVGDHRNADHIYEVGGKQYISIAVGWGGVAGLGSKFTEQINPGAIYTFALNEKTPMPAFAKQSPKHLINLTFSATKEEVSEGSILYLQYCNVCHGGTAQGGGALPDLAYSGEGIHKIFKDIVLKGLLLSNGMPNFGDRLNGEKVAAIQNYILAKAKEQIANQEKLIK